MPLDLGPFFGLPASPGGGTAPPSSGGGSGVVPVIPDVGGWGGDTGNAQTGRDTLNAQPTISETQVTVCAADAPLRFAYGLNRVGAMLLQPVTFGPTDLLLPFVIGRGLIDGIAALELGNAAMDPAITSTTYLGSASPPIDPWLQAAWSSQGKTYADTLPGIAWGVLRIPSTVTGSILDLAITFRGLKVYDPRDGTQTLGLPSTYKYSANPALWLADFIANASYGRGELLDWTSVAAVADINDQVVGGSARRGGGIVFDTMRAVQDVEDTLKQYAGCFVVREPGAVRFIPDAPVSSSFAFTNGVGSGGIYVDPGYWADGYCEGGDTAANYIAGSVRLMQRARKNSPTVVTVMYTDTTVVPWVSRPFTEKGIGVDAGTTPWREEQVQMPGIQDAGWARREALRRLNGYIASDLSATLIGTGEAVQLRVGDVVTITDTEGLEAKPFRLTGHKPRELGLWDETLTEYDPQLYSDAVAVGGGIPDTVLPLPSQVPPVTDLVAVEDRYTTIDKVVHSRIVVTWTAPAGFPFALRYLTELWDGPTLVDTATGSTTSYAWASPEEGRLYIIRVSALWTASSSTPVQTSILVQGKNLPPPDVASFQIEQFGAWVLFEWSRVVDEDAIKRYEIRRCLSSPTSIDDPAWLSATIVDAVDALALRSNNQPAGTWYYAIVAIDSTERPSLTPKVTQFKVIADSTAHFLGQYAYTAPTLVHVKAYANRDGLTRYITDFGVAWGTLFGGSPMTSFPNPVDSYHATGTSSLETEWYDVGVDVTAQWTAAVNVTDDAGTASVEIDLSPDGVTAITTYSGASAKGPGRFVRVRIATTGAMTIKGLPTITVTANPNTEYVSGTSSASVPVTVTLAGHYFAENYADVNVVGLGTVVFGLTANFVPSPTAPNTIDVEVRDYTNALVVRDFLLTFVGISY